MKSAVTDIWSRNWYVLAVCFSHRLLPHLVVRVVTRWCDIKISCILMLSFIHLSQYGLQIIYIFKK